MRAQSMETPTPVKKAPFHTGLFQVEKRTHRGARTPWTNRVGKLATESINETIVGTLSRKLQKFFITDAGLAAGKRRQSDIERLRNRVHELENRLKCGGHSHSEDQQIDEHLAFHPTNAMDFSQLQQADLDPLASEYWWSTLTEFNFLLEGSSVGRQDQDSCLGLHGLVADDSAGFLHSSCSPNLDGNGAQNPNPSSVDGSLLLNAGMRTEHPIQKTRKGSADLARKSCAIPTQVADQFLRQCWVQKQSLTPQALGNLETDNLHHLDNDSLPQCFEHGCAGRTFSSAENLRRHIRERDTSSQAECPLCFLKFTRKGNRDAHLSKNRCKIVSVSSARDTSSQIDCPFCFLTFTRKGNRDAHLSKNRCKVVTAWSAGNLDSTEA